MSRKCVQNRLYIIFNGLGMLLIARYINSKMKIIYIMSYVIELNFFEGNVDNLEDQWAWEDESHDINVSGLLSGYTI